MRLGPTVGAILVAAVMLGVDGTAAVAALRPFRVTSPAFPERGEIPEGFTCAGEGASLPVRWSKPPRRTEQLALVMDDPDAPSGTFVHWVAWGIDPAARRLPEEVLPPEVVEGVNSAARPGYLGPCPPPADGPHRYRITMYALDAAPDVAPGEATASELRSAIAGHVLAKDRTVGRYDR